MYNKPLSLSELDAISSDYENDWQEKPLVAVKEFAAQQLDPRSVSYPELLLELAIIDLQKRWDLRARKIAAQVKRGESEENVSLGLPPSYADYLDLFAESELPPNAELRMAQSELEVRWVDGDIPDPDEYRSAFPGIRRPDRDIPRVRLMSHQRVVFQTELFGTLLIGRRGKGEPESPTLLPGPPRKLICCELTETTTSRNQLELWACSRLMVWVANSSTNRTLMLGTDFELAPGARKLVSIESPLQIALKESAIVVDRG